MLEFVSLPTLDSRRQHCVAAAAAAAAAQETEVELHQRHIWVIKKGAESWAFSLKYEGEWQVLGYQPYCRPIPVRSTQEYEYPPQG